MRRRRKRRDLQTHPSGPPPTPTHQSCPGEGELHSDPSAPQMRAHSSDRLLWMGTSSRAGRN